MTDTLEVGVGVPAERVTPLKPSEALRLGRLRFPRRIEGDYFNGRNGACAIGAIWAGSGGRRIEEVERRFPVVDQEGCPIGCDLPRVRTLSHLNDDHHWSDDQIVTWLEGLGL